MAHYNHITRAATKENAEEVAHKIGKHPNSIYKMWGDPEFDRFSRFIELYEAAADVSFCHADIFYQTFKSIRDARAQLHAKEVARENTSETAARAAKEGNDCACAALTGKSHHDRIKEAGENVVAALNHLFSLGDEDEDSAVEHAATFGGRRAR